MFFNCRSLTSVDVSSFDTSKVEHMYEMFSGFSSLETLKTPEKNAVETDLPATMYDENDQEYHTLPILEKSIDLVKRTSIEKASGAGVSLSYGYTRKAYTPDLTVKVNGTELVEGTDYTVKYENNIKPGTATITITGIGTYTGTRIKKFEIVECASDLVSGRTYLIIPKNESSTAVCALSGRMVNDTTVYITNRSKSEAMRFKAVKNSDGTWSISVSAGGLTGAKGQSWYLK